MVMNKEDYIKKLNTIGGDKTKFAPCLKEKRSMLKRLIVMLARSRTLTLNIKLEELRHTTTESSQKLRRSTLKTYNKYDWYRYPRYSKMHKPPKQPNHTLS